MERRTITVYKFTELEGRAKEKARDWVNDSYFWGDEAIKSLEAFAKHFRANIENYQIDFTNSSPSFCRFSEPDEMDRRDLARIIRGLGDYNKKTGRGLGDCKLTGFDKDEDAADGARLAYLHGERDIAAILDAGYHSWLKAVHADYEDQVSDESTAEMCENNDYAFLLNGEPAPRD